MRQGTGRPVTIRPMEFRKRTAALPPVETAVVESSEEEEQHDTATALPVKGRRTGVRLRVDGLARDEFGLERLSDFWNAEDIKAALQRESLDSDVSIGARGTARTSTSTRQSTYSDSTVDPRSSLDDGASPISANSKEVSSASPTSVGTPQSHLADASLNDPHGDEDAESPDLDASKRLTFADSAEKRRSGVSPIGSPEDASLDSAHKRKSTVSFASMDGRKSTASFVKTPGRASELPDSSLDSSGMADAEPKAKRPRKEGTLVDRHEKMGRASYLHTDSYAAKNKRLSDLAPRPEPADDGRRASKRRKMRPLQYWRHERVEYARGDGAAVPEVVDLQVRSPEATPWRRKPRKSAEQQDPQSVDSKKATVRKKKASKKRKEGKENKAPAQAAVKKALEQQQPAEESSDDEEEAPAPLKKAATPRRASPKGKAAPASELKNAPRSDRKLKKRSPFFAFCTEKRGEVKTKYPELPITEQAKILGQMWAALSEKGKDKYATMVAA
jgi:hypothetical protein